MLNFTIIIQLYGRLLEALQQLMNIMPLPARLAMTIHMTSIPTLQVNANVVLQKEQSSRRTSRASRSSLSGAGAFASEVKSVIAASLEDINADLEEVKSELKTIKKKLLAGDSNKFLEKEYDRLTSKEAELLKQRGQITANLSLPS